jgi:radical SAM protein with 4Fe4S-binding SPASM domain
MCVHGSGEHLKTGFIDMDFAKEIIRQVAQGGAYSIKFNWRGEPSLYKQLPELIAYAKQQGIQEIQINTNGVPFSEESIRSIVEAGLDRIIFSVDAASEETYGKIRVGGNYQKLITNIEFLLKIRMQLNRVKPFVRVQMVRMKENKDEVDEFYKRWKGKADDIRVSDVTDRGQGNQLSVGDQVAVGRRKCPQPWLRMVVNREGLVMPCCSDWHCQWIIGDAKKESLVSIWRGDTMKSFRKLVRGKGLDEFEPCRSCFVKESYTWEYKKTEEGSSR